MPGRTVDAGERHLHPSSCALLPVGAPLPNGTRCEVLFLATCVRAQPVLDQTHQDMPFAKFNVTANVKYNSQIPVRNWKKPVDFSQNLLFVNRDGNSHK